MLDHMTHWPTELDHALERSRAGDARETEHLLQLCYPLVSRLALSILEDADDAEDAAQEALIAALGALDRFRGDASFSTWLTAITVNTCRRSLRRRRVRRALAVLLQGAAARTHPASVEQAAQRHAEDAALWAAVDALDEKHRLPVILRYAHDLPVSEIAQALGISEGTVHSRLHYARRALYGRLVAAEVVLTGREEGTS